MAPTPSPIVTENPISPTSNNQDIVALAALVLAAGAFIIAFLQFLIEYVTSSSVREKCSRGAIGGWQIYTNTTWDIWNWRLHVVYPQVDLQCSSLLKERMNAALKRELLFSDLLSASDCGWRDISLCEENNHLRWWHIWYGSNVLVKGDTAMTIFGLPIKLRVAWLKYLWQNRSRHRPLWARASWANMVECIGAEAELGKDLVLRKERADVIPTSVDAPIQTTTLADIGLCCFALGLREVDIDVSKGTIRARNEYATMSTSESVTPGLPPLISLSGDLESLRASVAKPLVSELTTAVAIANGKLDFILFTVNSFSCVPSVILYGLQNRWTNDDWSLYSSLEHFKKGEHLGVGNLFYEAELARQSTDDWGKTWKTAKIGAAPSLIQIFAFLPYVRICSGFPRKAFISPYDEHVSPMALAWWNDRQKLCKIDDALTLKYRITGISFMKVSNCFDLTGDDVMTSHGVRSWIMHSAKRGLDSLDDELQNVIANIDEPLPILDIISLILTEGLEVRQKLEDERARMVNKFAGRQITLEAALWFTLYTVERRIESFWTQLSPKTEEQIAEEALTDTEELQILMKDKSQIANFLFGYTSIGQKIEPAVASFLGLWITVCHETDPFTLLDDFIVSFDRVLDSWQNDDLPCIMEPPEMVRQVLPPLDDVPLRKRRDFFSWASEGTRRNLMQRLIPWLQLRGILVYYFLNCFGDSSAVAAAESSELHVQMA